MSISDSNVFFSASAKSRAYLQGNSHAKLPTESETEPNCNPGYHKLVHRLGAGSGWVHGSTRGTIAMNDV